MMGGKALDDRAQDHVELNISRVSKDLLHTSVLIYINNPAQGDNSHVDIYHRYYDTEINSDCYIIPNSMDYNGKELSVTDVTWNGDEYIKDYSDNNTVIFYPLLPVFDDCKNLKYITIIDSHNIIDLTKNKKLKRINSKYANYVKYPNIEGIDIVKEDK